MSAPALDRRRHIVGTVRDDPRSITRFARSAWQSHVVGPLTAHRRPGAVAVFHVGRCGSTVLTDLLDQHPGVRSDGETYVRVLQAAKAAGIEATHAEVDPVEYVAGRLRRSGPRWFVYDLKFDHVERLGSSLKDYLEGIEQAGVSRLIVLRRRNLLRKLVSEHMATRRGRYHSTDPGEVRRFTVRIDPDSVAMDGHIDSLNGHFERIRRQYDEFRRLTTAIPLLELDYEADIAEGPRTAYERSCAFLGIAPAPVDVRLQRLNPYELHEVIENIDEVARALAGTDDDWMVGRTRP